MNVCLGNLKDSRPIHYPISLEIEVNKWSNNVKSKTNVASEWECTALSILEPMDVDFYVHDTFTGACYMGKLGSVGTETIVSTETKVRFHKTNPEIYINTVFDAKFGTNETYWTPYIYESVDVQSAIGQFVECGILCDLAPKCQFFGHTDTKCHFGSYNHTGSEFTTGSNGVNTYHQTNVFFPFIEPKYFSISNVDSWQKFVYLIDPKLGLWDCHLTCLNEPDCDFHVVFSPLGCCLGAFDYTGPRVTTDTSSKIAYLFKGRSNT